LAYAGGSRAQRKFQLSPRARFFASSTESVEFWQDLIEITAIIKLSALRTRAVGNIGGGEIDIKSLPSVSTLLSGVSGF